MKVRLPVEGHSTPRVGTERKSDNAIPIEGWINDPTDNDLLHILPMLEALQYATDVRAFLGLRRGEVEGAQ